MKNELINSFCIKAILNPTDLRKIHLEKALEYISRDELTVYVNYENALIQESKHIIEITIKIEIFKYLFYIFKENEVKFTYLDINSSKSLVRSIYVNGAYIELKNHHENIL